MHFYLNRAVVSAFLALTFFSFVRPTSAAIRDGGVDPTNLSRGSWIYLMPTAMNQLGGNVSSVTNLTTLMTFMKNEGLQYVTIKAAQADTVFKVSGATNFTTTIVEAGHAAGLKVFGYIYTTGSNVTGEIAMCDYIFQQGADGLIYDAEGEWETVGGSASARSALATNLCGTVRAHWPNKFMGLSTWPYRALHPNLPYKEFAYYCDVIMPQVYWIELGDTPTAAVTHMNNDWNSWKSGLSGIWTNAIKPFVGTGQGWSSTSGTVTAAQITEFENALKTVSSPASPGGYKNVDYWRAELHPMTVWNAIRTNFTGNSYTNAPAIQYSPNVTAGSSTVSVTWPTDQPSDSVVEYGTSASYGTLQTNATVLWYHTVNLSGLSPDTTYHYRVKSKGTNNLTGVSADYVFTTLTAPVSDVIVESRLAGGALNSNPPYSDTTFADSSIKSTAAGLSGTGSRYAFSTSSQYSLKPTLAVSGGTYDVYLTHGTASSISTDVVMGISQIGCTGLPSTTTIFRQPNGDTWEYLGQMTLNSGITVPTVTFTYSSGTLNSTTGRIYSDSAKFVYVQPPPSAPSISTQPQNQIVNQGSTATFTVVASGTATLEYQWRFNDVNISGATASTYIKNNAQPADAGNYSVAITNGVGSVISSNASLTVIVPPAITSQPEDQTNSIGAAATFTVSVSGTAPFGYQWFKGETALTDGGDVSGAATATLTLSNLTESDETNYSVVVTNAAGSATSDPATLTVTSVPMIVSQPVNRTNSEGTTATFSVVANGATPLNYQWQKNGSDLTDAGNISGANSTTLTLSSVTLGDAAEYSVVVTNALGSATSDNATLTVIGSDQTSPTIAITSPASGSSVGAAVSFSGWAKDTLPGVVVDVKYRLWPETNFTSATLSAPVSGKLTWSTTNLTMTPGTNFIHAYCIDAGGNSSAIKTNKVYYDVLSPLTVKISGNGQIKNSFFANITNNQQISLLVGRPYALTAYINKGTNYVFTNWTDGASAEVTNGLIYKFLMESNLILQANFITNPFTPVAGTYVGLFSDTNNGVAHQSAGFFQVKVTEKATYSCKMFFDGDTVSGGGKFNLSGQASRVIKRDKKGKPDVNLFLDLDWSSPNSSHILGTLSEGSWTSDMFGLKAAFNLNNPATAYVGRSTFLLSRTNYPAQSPGGFGYGALTNKVLGTTVLTGGLGDGAKIAQNVLLSQDGQWPLYVKLYRHTNSFTTADYRGAIMGWVTFTNHTPVGTLIWMKTAEASNYLYPAGFTNEVDMIGSPYNPPATGTRMLNIANGTIVFADGNLTSPFAYNVAWATNNVISTTLTVNKPTFSLAAKTGLFKGTFYHPQLGKTNFFGAALQDQNYVGGYFLGTDQSGSILLQGN